ncbi:hypothetical protein [Streptomyces sp. NPDC055210]
MLPSTVNNLRNINAAVPCLCRASPRMARRCSRLGAHPRAMGAGA